MYKVTTYNGMFTITEEEHPQYNYIVASNDDVSPVQADTPLGAFAAAGFDVLSVVAMSFE